MEEKNEKFGHGAQQAVQRSSVYDQKAIKVTSADSNSNREHTSFNLDLDATRHVSVVVLNKEDNILKVLHPSPGRMNTHRERKLLVLDVNGLLADIVCPPPKDCKADTNILRRAIFRRPFCSDFLKFCFERFSVGIWSSRSRKIIDRIVDYLLGDMKYKLVFCWDLSHCTRTGFKTLENKHKELVFKELRKIWEGNDTDLLWEKGHYNESNTLLLDDSPYKALLNPRNTAIFPYSYNFKDGSDNSLGPEGDIRLYLEGLATVEDVKKYVEEHPFGQRAIDEASSSWDYYHRVILSCSLVPSRI
ncbi:uncharacterized protein LOC127809518 [Diospyros lotus]|uniref:uncharacterized protein LOC127809518 n=1 Tax=Diospyros lotus TaxID=55363 RepID=UPI00224ED64C|nr:uncharacterized protein LOC127809518 [Diospyros lotus]